MTDVTIPATPRRRSDPAPIPFRRLLSVEARKLFDTRTSKIIFAIVVALTIASIVARGIDAGPELQTLITTAGIGYSTLLPVLGILTVTGEWSHRTALTTFTLEPRRGRVLAAKCLPPVILTVLAVLFSILVALPVTAVAARLQDVPPVWEVAPLALLGWSVACVLVVAQGLAVGMLLLNAPAAIVICLSSVFVWSAVSRLGDVGEILTDWLDLGTAAAPLMDGNLTGGDAARLAVATLCWIVIPMAVGVARVLRKEVT
jgi:hypothetical protein